MKKMHVDRHNGVRVILLTGAIAVMSTTLAGCGTPKLVRLYQGQLGDSQVATLSSYGIEGVNGTAPPKALSYQLLQGTHRFQIKNWGMVEVELEGGHVYEVGSLLYFRDGDGKAYSQRQAAASLLSANNNNWPGVYLNGNPWICVLNTPTNMVWINESKLVSVAIEGIESPTGAVTKKTFALSVSGTPRLVLRSPSGEILPLDHGDNNPQVTCSTTLKVEMLAQMLVGQRVTFSNVAPRCASLLQDIRDSGEQRIMYIRDQTSGAFIASSNDSVLQTITD